MPVEIGDGKYKPNILDQPGKCAVYKYITVFDLMQPAEALYCNVVRTEY